MHTGNKEYIQHLFGKPEEKRPLGIHTHTTVTGVRNLQEIGKD
jgi:hypothetical protein